MPGFSTSASSWAVVLTTLQGTKDVSVCGKRKQVPGREVSSGSVKRWAATKNIGLFTTRAGFKTLPAICSLPGPFCYKTDCFAASALLGSREHLGNPDFTLVSGTCRSWGTSVTIVFNLRADPKSRSCNKFHQANYALVQRILTLLCYFLSKVT